MEAVPVLLLLVFSTLPTGHREGVRNIPAGGSHAKIHGSKLPQSAAEKKKSLLKKMAEEGFLFVMKSNMSRDSFVTLLVT